MELLSQVAGSPRPVRLLQDKHGANDLVVMASRRDLYFAKLLWRRFSGERINPANGIGSHVINNNWMAVGGCAVKTSNSAIENPRQDYFLCDVYAIDHDELMKYGAEEQLRQSQDELRLLSVQLLTIQESERQRIASDLHDGIGQSLTLIKLSMESLAQLIEAGERQAALKSTQLVLQKIKDTMGELRRTTMDLRPSMLDDLGIIPTLSWFFRDFESVWRGKQIDKDVSIAESDVPIPLKSTIFRILQEAMCNIAKHANADYIRVDLKKVDGILQFSIEDNGCGFDPDSISLRRGSDHGFGLLTMKERARSTDGTFEMKSVIDHGTRILISWRLTHGEIDEDASKLCAR